MEIIMLKRKSPVAISKLMFSVVQRGIQPSDIADAISNGTATISSEQSLLFQTKARLICLFVIDISSH
jgi:hypothetical protein